MDEIGGLSLAVSTDRENAKRVSMAESSVRGHQAN